MEPLTKTNFADQAEKVILGLVEKDKFGNSKIRLTTSKIRNLLSMTNVLYGKACQWKQDELGEELIRDIQYLKMRFAYEAGRENEVRKLVEHAHIMEYIKDIGNSREQLLLFCNFIESLVAYHKFYGGKDR